MKPLSESDLREFQSAIEKDYGIKLEGNDLYQAAFNLLKFFEALLDFDRKDKKEEEEVQKSS
ncbi:MAG TPA: hypothetical protein VMR41_00145 [Patescibacteria group bacterium]|nr:hypothetical protein [Patescibacteria group bacterium]